jgi:oligopeptide transport system substrate-binding protein
MKKLLFLSLMVLTTLVIAACGSQEVTVTFDSQGGSNVAAVTVTAGQTVSEPAAPTYPEEGGLARSFVGWFTNAGATTAYNFSTPVEASLTLYAGWSENLVVSFNTKTAQIIESVLLDADGGTLTAPTPPTRAGYRFGGWFIGLPGLTWLEPQAVQFPLEVTKSMTLNAYWEPLDSRAVNYSKSETFIESLTSDIAFTFNPFTYLYSFENSIMDSLSTALYSTTVDWDKAIEDGVADYPSDFSKIESGEFPISSLDFIEILIGATRNPVDSNGEDYLDENGRYDRVASANINDTEWTYHIRDDLYFVDGYHITARTFEYALRQFLDPIQFNSRSSIYYKTATATNGYPILNAFEYYSGEVTWDEVGFEIIDDYTFKITFWEDINQNSARDVGNIRLVHPEIYNASLTLDRASSTYGTPSNPYVSYGAYLIKSWDENQRIVLNKNFDYLLKDTINYKSISYEIIDTIEQRYQLFEQGDLSVVGLTQEYAAQYSEWKNSLLTLTGFPEYIIMNTRGSMRTDDDAHQVPSVMFDKSFRQALFYGFNRNFYASNVNVPNQPSLLAVPNNTKQYLADPLYYSQSPQFLSLLQEFSIDPESGGYYPERALSLFNQAYDRWIADGNEGKVVLRMVVLQNETTERIARYLKAHYEELFGADRLELRLDINPLAARNALLFDLEYDITLASIGFGSSTNIARQYGYIAMMAGLLHGPTSQSPAPWGFTNPYDSTTEDGFASYWTEEFEVDMTNTYNYLSSVDELSAVNQALLNLLVEDGDKPAGILRASMSEIGSLVINTGIAFFGSASEPYPGASVDAFNLTAGMNRLLLDWVNLIPTVTSASVALYADNVVITWPEYSEAFGWGANRYRYLSSDSDFAEGLYNSFGE